MRPIIMQVLLMVLSVAAFANAELRPTGAPRHSPSPPPNNLSSKSYDLTFEDFKKRYGKQYSSVAEQDYRQLIFQKNLADLNKHNSNPQRTYNMKPNAFLDVSRDEFQQVYTTTRPPDEHSKNVTEEVQSQGHRQQEPKSNKEKQLTEGHKDRLAQRQTTGSELANKSIQNSSNFEIENENSTRFLQTITIEASVFDQGSPNNYQSNSTATSQTDNRTSNSPISEVFIDWSPYSGNVRFQGFCGACYAFSTVDTVAAHLAIKSFGFYYELSVQQVIDCTNNGLTYGCRGGYLEGSLTQIQMNGIVSETAYPFSSGNSGFEGKCKFNTGSFKVKSFTTLQVGSCPAVINQLKKGPVSAGISGYNLRFYDSGVFNDCSIRDQLDHAIMIVGYSSGQGWRIKNSWGVDWGQEGFGWIAEGNTCGICNMTVSITV